MALRDNVALRDSVWFHTGGVAQYFALGESVGKIVEAVGQAVKEGLAYQVIGAGSHILVSDAGFPGLIIKNVTRGFVFVPERSQIIADAGLSLGELATQTVSRGYGGLEFLLGLPGTVGGAIYNNVSVGSRALGDYVRSATLLDAAELGAPPRDYQLGGAIRKVDRAWFDFAHRMSRLKKERRQSPTPPIILSATLQLALMSPDTLKRRLQSARPDRRKSPDGGLPQLECFDNLAARETFRHRQASDVARSVDRPVYIVDRATVKNWRVGAIGFAPSNPNMLVNYGQGSSRDAAAAIELARTALEPIVGQRPTPLIEFAGYWE